METFFCSICGFAYDETTAAHSIDHKPLALREVGSDWACPTCGVGPDLFTQASIESKGEEL